MNLALIPPLLTYMVVMIFTPGPNNISSATLGMKSKYRECLPWFLGIASGFLVIISVTGLLTDFLTRSYSAISPWLKWIGVAYMLWLAASLFVEHRSKKALPLREGYLAGFLLQFINPKGVLFAITLFVSFADLASNRSLGVLIIAISCSVLAFVSVSMWAALSMGLSKLLRKKAFNIGYRIAMAVLLLYCALSIALHQG